jgi:hypothetical protein
MEDSMPGIAYMVRMSTEYLFRSSLRPRDCGLGGLGVGVFVADTAALQAMLPHPFLDMQN